MPEKMPFVLLGAGASADAGVPTTAAMTHCIISGFAGLGQSPKPLHILRFVYGGLVLQKGIRNEDPFQGVGVEDLFAAVEMLGHRHELAASPFVAQWNSTIDELEKYYPEAWDFRRLQAELDDLFSPRKHQWAANRVIDELREILNKALAVPSGEWYKRISEQMIEKLVDLVWVTDKDRVNYLKPLLERGRNGRISIATLNYDNTIELAADESGVSYNTGIGEWSEKGSITLPLMRPDCGVELLKLHGSINWRRTTRRPSAGDITSEEIHEERELIARNHIPAVIFGAGNKLTAKGPYLDIFSAFKRRLEEHDELLIVGYSFRDEHVNEVVRAWLNKDTERKMVVIDQEDGLREGTHDESFWGEVNRLVSTRRTLIRVGAAAGISEYFLRGGSGPFTVTGGWR